MAYRHFAYRAAEEVLRRFPERSVYVVEAGVTPSGKIHLGNFNDVVIADAVLKALKDLGFEAIGYLVIDSKDPFRRPPEFAPEEFKRESGRYVGRPFEELPDPWGCHESYAVHFVEPVETSFEDYGVEIRVVWASKLHKDARFVELLERVIDERENVRNIMNRVRERAGHKTLYPPGWIPFRPQCANCGRIDEVVKPLDVLGGHLIKYKCAACGHEGIADVRKGEGKPPWRVDWPLRWVALDVHFEPLGKDHMASGSGYDTGSALAREFFGREPPVPVFYDFVYWVERKNGEKVYSKFSKRRGVGLGVDEWLRYAPPEVLRFQILKRDVTDIQSEALSHWEFDMRFLPDYVEEFDRYEKVYFDIIEGEGRKSQLVIDTYRLTMAGKVPAKRPRRVSYKSLALVALWMRDVEDGMEILRRQGKLRDLEDWEVRDVRRRLVMARNWVEAVGATSVLLPLEDAASRLLSLPEPERGIIMEFLSQVASGLRAEEAQARIRELAERVGLKTRSERLRVYRGLYQALLGESSGPPVRRLLANPGIRGYLSKLYKRISEHSVAA